MLLSPSSWIARVALLMAISIIPVTESLSAKPMALTPTEIEQKIIALPQWQLEGKTITRTFKFKNFIESVNFVNQLVEPAEAAAHHPDLVVSYSQVTVSLTTHDAGGLTQLDFDLAQAISELSP